MPTHPRRLLLSFLFLLMAATNGVAEDIRHSFFIAGPSFTGIIEEDGTEGWDTGRAGARDGFVLANGNVLITWSDEVKEFTPEKRVVFHYRKAAYNKEIGTAQRLDNGHTLIAELGSKPRLLEVDSKGDIVLQFPLQPETPNAHMQTRMARKLPNGNYLVPHLLAFKVKEYTATGEVVREIRTDLDELGGKAAENWPFTAIMLDDSRILVNLTHGNKTVIFDADGSVNWKLSNEDFTNQPFDDACGGQRLPNGNVVICSYHAPKGIKIFEVTPDKKIVWTYEGPHRAHEVQILTTNGEKLIPPPQK